MHNTVKISFFFMALWLSSCAIPLLVEKNQNKTVPGTYNGAADTVNVARVNWKAFFKDPNLQNLIELGIKNNQEINILVQEI
jgi:multidrug efflux system outer membrane protein